MSLKRYVLYIFNNHCFLIFHTLVSGRNREFSRQNSRIARGFAQEFFRSGKCYRPGQRLKRRGKSSSLHSKQFFACGLWIFSEGCHTWRTYRSPWPTLPGPGCHLLDGSILLKVLLETRLQSKSFDTLDDLLGFRVQKL